MVLKFLETIYFYNSANRIGSKVFNKVMKKYNYLATGVYFPRAPLPFPEWSFSYVKYDSNNYLQRERNYKISHTLKVNICLRNIYYSWVENLWIVYVYINVFYSINLNIINPNEPGINQVVPGIY